MDVYVFIQRATEKIKGRIGKGGSLLDSNINISTIYYNTSFIPLLNEISIKGIHGITNIYPEKQSVWSIVDEEIHTGEFEWLIRFNIIKMNKTGITANNVRRLCENVGIIILEFSENIKDRYEGVFLRVKTPPIYDNVRKILNIEKDINIKWNPGQIINYHKLTDLEDFNNYAERMRDIKNKLIEEGKIDESKNISTVRSTSNFENAISYIYAVSDGSNLYDLIQRDDIDPNKTISNNVNEIIQMYGAEAARLFLGQRIYNIVINNENYIDPRHPFIIADHMIRVGYITPISLLGMREQSVGTLTEAGYKMPKDAFHSAAISNTKESLNPTYASLMTGKLMRIGTGLPTVSLNSNVEQKWFDELRKDVLYDLDAETLADIVPRLEREANEEIESFKDIEEQFYALQDESGNITTTGSTSSNIFGNISSIQQVPIISPSMTKSTIIPPSITSQSIQINLFPSPVISDATIELSNRIKEIPTIPCDDIEDITF
uniref:DNA-directed RNA polymerase n=1 Tax=Pithovirus LCPAC102 TaxID=2506587 RepID=A0A4D5XFC1_9VIRU|nr:MAG: RNA polymerase Rpb1 domain 5 protein [Pithovirus LCPAC102]